MDSDAQAAASGSSVSGLPVPWALWCPPVSTWTTEGCHPVAYVQVILCDSETGGELQVLHVFSVAHLSSAALLSIWSSWRRPVSRW